MVKRTQIALTGRSNIAALCAILLMVLAAPVAAHDPATGRATSILNEGVMVEHGDTKVLFDPIYDRSFNTYPEMGQDLKSKIINGAAPYDGVDAIFVSHYHGDHFSVPNMLRLLAEQPSVKLFAPAAAIDAMREAPGWDDAFSDRITSVSLELTGPAARYELDGILVEAVRVPHSGWPERHTDVENIVFRVTLADSSRVMHFGDAGTDDSHFAPHRDFFRRVRTGIAFVPYWMFGRADSDAFVDNVLNAESAIGVHVPVDVPEQLKQLGKDYFSTLGEMRSIPETQ